MREWTSEREYLLVHVVGGGAHRCTGSGDGQLATGKNA
jgi:hypothetical protein